MAAAIDLPDTMTAVRLNEYGGPALGPFGGVEIGQTEIEQLHGERCLVRMKRCALNPVDYKIASGEIQELFDLPLPHTLGCDGVGEVVQTGPLADAGLLGKTVAVSIAVVRGGAMAQYALVGKEEMAVVPDGLDEDVAAGLGVVASTAHQALHEGLGIQSGERLLILGGSGAVGGCAVQLAKAAGAHVVAVGAGEHEERVRGFGADEYVDYLKAEYHKTVDPVDAVLDAAGTDLHHAFHVLKDGGRLVSVVQPVEAGEYARPDAAAQMIVVTPNHDRLADVLSLAAAGKLHVAMDEQMPMADAVKALTKQRDGYVVGKLLLIPDGAE